MIARTKIDPLGNAGVVPNAYGRKVVYPNGLADPDIVANMKPPGKFDLDT